MPNNESVPMKNCEMRYKNSMDNYDHAIDAAERNDWETVNIQLSIVMDLYSQCRISDEQWDSFNNKLKKMVDVCFDLLRQSKESDVVSGL